LIVDTNYYPIKDDEVIQCPQCGGA